MTFRRDSALSVLISQLPTGSVRNRRSVTAAVSALPCVTLPSSLSDTRSIQIWGAFNTHYLVHAKNTKHSTCICFHAVKHWGKTNMQIIHSSTSIVPSMMTRTTCLGPPWLYCILHSHYNMLKHQKQLHFHLLVIQWCTCLDKWDPGYSISHHYTLTNKHHKQFLFTDNAEIQV